MGFFFRSTSHARLLLEEEVMILCSNDECSLRVSNYGYTNHTRMYTKKRQICQIIKHYATFYLFLWFEY